MIIKTFKNFYQNYFDQSSRFKSSNPYYFNMENKARV